MAKAAAGLPAAVAQPPEGSNPFPLRHLFLPMEFDRFTRLLIKTAFLRAEFSGFREKNS